MRRGFRQPIWKTFLWLQKQASMMARMLLKNFLQVCSEELQKAGRAIAALYEMIREADERALAFLIAILRGD